MDIFENGKKLPLVEKFYTLQGEGYHTGKAAYFIRIGGCDIGCRWCDTKISWNADIHPLLAVDDLVNEVKDLPAKSVVVTGGEPSLYPLDYLTSQLKQIGIQTFIETSGAHKLTGEWDWICLSPKRNQPPLAEIYKKANELKVIIYEEEDLLWAEESAAKVNSNCLLYLQPEWSRHKEWTPRLVDYVKQKPKWRISIQSHKFMRIP